MGGPMYTMFGIIAGSAFLVAALRWAALRGYETLLEGMGPRDLSRGSVHGTYSGRRADIGQVSAVRASHTPSKVQVSLACGPPLRLEAHTRSLAISLRKAVGVLEERKSGVQDLDRRFVFQFDDRPKMEAALSRIEVRQSLHALADLGADFVLLTNGRLTAEVPEPFILPVGKDRIGRVIAALHALASGMESALSVPSPAWTDRTPAVDESADVESLWPASPTSGYGISGPVGMAILFVSLTLGALLLTPFWDFHSRVPWQARLETVHDRLPTAALLAAGASFVARFLASRRSGGLAFSVSWPLLVNALLVLAVYVLLRASSIPEIEQALGRELQFIPAGLKAAATAAGVVFGAALVGAIAGRAAAHGQDSSGG